MGCLSSAYFSILINGFPIGFFKASKVHRQGGPLFPFLFSLMAEAFRMMLKNIARKERLEGFQAGTNEPFISHLQYDDGTLIFCDADPVMIKNISNFLIFCQLALGLKVGSKLGPTGPLSHTYNTLMTL
ncbi:hypothetical protein AMTRI_Chr11g97600 [Amborella trichopoda]